MSMVMYGAARLVAPELELKRSIKEYWRQLAGLHDLWVGLDSPANDYLQPEIADLWRDPSWLRFSLAADPEEGAADGLFFRAATRAARVLQREQAGRTPKNVWPWVPQWRCINFMFWHEDLVDAYLVVENTSGDMALSEQIRFALLTEALEEIWWEYCYKSSEDPVIYHLNMMQLPR
jgi:hypothetical protein